jgi:epoxyqueuosine reductase QueG
VNWLTHGLIIPVQEANNHQYSSELMQELAADISAWALDLGFQASGITDTDLSAAEARLMNWLHDGHHGEMQYMERHGTRRSRPADLVPGTVRIISVRMDYWPETASAVDDLLQQPTTGFVSRYSLGRDYHKVLRSVTGHLSTAPRCSKKRWPKKPGWAGSGSTATC